MDKKELEKQIELLVKDDERNQQTIIKQSEEIEKLNNIINKAIKKCDENAEWIEEVEGAYSDAFIEIEDILKGSDKE